MSFRPAAPKPKPAGEPKAEPKAERKRATIRFTEAQWDQLRAACFEKRTTIQKLVITGLANTLERFDA